jgi:hypothetical protein
VRVECASGESRSYEVTLRDVVRGAQPVRETSFDAIGKVMPCEGPAQVEFLDGKPVPAAQRDSYIVLGFSFRAGEGPPSLELEGILDYRHESDSQASTTPVYWRGRGERLESVGDAETAYYGFRVRPGKLGLAGFLLNRDPLSALPARFLRIVDIAPDTAAFLGAFRMERSDRGMLTILIDPADGAWSELQRARPRYRERAWARPAILKLPSTSSVVRE